VPQFLDLGDVDAAHRGQRLFCAARRHPDPEAAGGELDQRKAGRGVEPVEQAGHDGAAAHASGRHQRLDRLAKPGRRAVGRLVRRRPHQRNRFGEIADIIVGIGKQHRVHALADQGAQHGRFDAGYVEVAGQRCQRQAAIWVRRR
jgi:hypothetical protein